eukprot:CAMPEP_0114488516 /NCGR_PEP_ID=MMETSP0109-20121206/1374_1 /TAXON_ID=29199 /ORGANISM="Chlorarachnion reptans, Strain CCCM449" /LENGTH=151 /DNA_ID=CAMNT_0001664919 /DNA_START=630 /DNA_END=1081 /DNA_ORIENTATION=-
MPTRPIRTEPTRSFAGIGMPSARVHREDKSVRPECCSCDRPREVTPICTLRRRLGTKPLISPLRFLKTLGFEEEERGERRNRRRRRGGERDESGKRCGRAMESERSVAGIAIVGERGVGMRGGELGGGLGCLQVGGAGEGGLVCWCRTDEG